MKNPKPAKEYSIVVPIYNEEGNVAILDKEIRAVMDKISKDYEVIYVNDGSTDNTLVNLRKLKKSTIVNLNRNYGQATALDAGFKQCQGKLVISMDGDLQNDPQDIPKMIKKLPVPCNCCFCRPKWMTQKPGDKRPGEIVFTHEESCETPGCDCGWASPQLCEKKIHCGT